MVVIVSFGAENAIIHVFSLSTPSRKPSLVRLLTVRNGLQGEADAAEDKPQDGQEAEGVDDAVGGREKTR